MSTSAAVNVNGAPVPGGGFSTTARATISIALASSAGVGIWDLALYDGDASTDIIAATAGILINPVAFTASLTMPNAAGVTMSLVSIVNGGAGPGVYAAANVVRFDVFIPQGGSKVVTVGGQRAIFCAARTVGANARHSLIALTAPPLFGTTLTQPGSADVVIGVLPQTPQNPAAVDLRVNGVCLPPAAFSVDAAGNVTARTLTGGFPGIQTSTTVTAYYDV